MDLHEVGQSMTEQDSSTRGYLNPRRNPEKWAKQLQNVRERAREERRRKRARMKADRTKEARRLQRIADRKERIWTEIILKWAGRLLRKLRHKRRMVKLAKSARSEWMREFARQEVERLEKEGFHWE